MTQFIPAGNLVLFRLWKDEAGFDPELQPRIATVIAAGPEATSCAAGDIVAIGRHNVRAIQLPGLPQENTALMNDNVVLGILQGVA